MKSLAVFILLFTAHPLLAQSQKIIDACGETYSNGNGKLRMVVGEPVIGMLNHTQAYVSQGFIHAKPATTIASVPTSGYSFSPNPFNERVIVKGDITKVKFFQLIDITGRILITQQVTTNSISIAQPIAPGVYTARIFGADNNTLHYSKIVKQ